MLVPSECRWLIVYDHAEDPELIREYWPMVSHGQAIITTRNRALSFELADIGMEVPNWDIATGELFLLHLLKTDIILEEEEASSAHELSDKLRGHAMAISVMAGLIHRRAMKITEFLELYNQHPGQLLGSHSHHGSRSINALWELSFKSLDADAHAILGVMSFVEPDSIPQALFEPPSPTDLPESLRFCADGYR